MVRYTLPSQDVYTYQIRNPYLKESTRYAPDRKRDGRTVQLLYASQSSFGGIKINCLLVKPTHDDINEAKEVNIQLFFLKI